MSRSFKRNFMIGIIVVLVFIVGVYLAVAFYFKDRFYSGTMINGIDCSGMTVQEVEDLISDDVADYTLTIFDREGSKEHIMGNQFDYTYVSDGSIQSMKDKQNSFLWILSLFSQEDYTMSAGSTYNAEKLKSAVASLEMFQSENVQEPKDAYVEKVDDQYVIVEEIQGNKADPDKVYELIKESVDNNEPALNLADHEEVYVKPAITSDSPELQSQASNWNDFLNLTITHEFGSRSETLTGETIQNWVSVDDDFNITVDRDQVYNYVESLAMQYNTFGNSRTIISTTTGSPVTVEGGDYGWAIYKEQETDALVEIIEKGESVSREPIYLFTAESREEKDYSNTYVEIDLARQKLYFYYEGTLTVESDVVTGTKDRNDTQTGTWPVMWKKTDTYLVGETWNNKVNYFIPFYENVGLHDASWRSSFGGSIYQSNGSHGCVNMPKDKVEQIYNLIPDFGTAVFVYYS